MKKTQIVFCIETAFHLDGNEDAETIEYYFLVDLNSDSTKRSRESPIPPYIQLKKFRYYLFMFSKVVQRITLLDDILF